MTDKDREAKKKYWYLFHHLECPVCGRSDYWKERVYTPKPDKPEDRHTSEFLHCSCSG